MNWRSSWWKSWLSQELSRMSWLRLEYLKISWLRDRQMTERRKNSDSHLQPKGISPNTIQPLDRHLASLLGSLGDLLKGNDDYAWPSLLPWVMVDGLRHLLVSGLPRRGGRSYFLWRLSVCLDKRGRLALSEVCDCETLLSQSKIPEEPGISIWEVRKGWNPLSNWQSCSRVPNTGTGTGTMKWVWVRVRVPSHAETRVRVPQWELGYGYNEMGMGTSTGTKPCWNTGTGPTMGTRVRVRVPSHVETRVRVPQWVLGYGYGYGYYMSLYIAVFLLNTVSQSTAFIMAKRFLPSSAMEILDNVHIYFTKEKINNAPLIDNWHLQLDRPST